MHRTAFLLAIWAALALPGAAAFQPTADLPALLEFENGTRVEGPAQWEARREELKRLTQAYMLGSFPTEVPALVSAKVVQRAAMYGSAVSEQVELVFATSNQATITVEIIAPTASPTAPLPVLLTQVSHRRWAVAAVARGYVSCVYPGGDELDQSSVFADAYPSATFQVIARRAWLASRVVDYLLTRPDVDASKIMITGHSRNGKQSIVAAAFDVRIAAVVSSSAGAPIASPYRFNGRYMGGEDPTDAPPQAWDRDQWWLPSLKSYAGREHELPVDGHFVTALVAPRPLLLASALNDHEGDIVFAMERNMLALKPVYELLGSPHALRSHLRPGDHHGYVTHFVPTYMDWADWVLGRGGDGAHFPDRNMTLFNWRAWLQRAGTPPPPPPATAPLPDRLAWTLGDPPALAADVGGTNGAEWGYITTMLQHEAQAAQFGSVARMGVSVGANLPASLYYSSGAVNRSSPAVVWLHPFSYSIGYTASQYGMGAGPVYYRLAQAGYVVLVLDLAGFGIRAAEAPHAFYTRFPRWSLLGHMVQDVRSAVDFLAGVPACSWCSGLDQPRSRPAVDRARIFVAGYAMGGMVALHAAALDARIAGVASFAGFAPLRTARERAASTGGLERLWSWHALLPRLGLLREQETSVPYDFDDLLAAAAPRPALVVAPTGDRFAPVDDVLQCIARANATVARQGLQWSIALETPARYNQFTDADQATLMRWLEQHASHGVVSA